MRGVFKTIVFFDSYLGLCLIRDSFHLIGEFLNRLLPQRLLQYAEKDRTAYVTGISCNICHKCRTFHGCDALSPCVESHRWYNGR